MDEIACNKSEVKALDEFISRITACAMSVNSRVMLINEIRNKLSGPEPPPLVGDAEKTNEPESIFDKFNNCIDQMERITKDLESSTDKLNRII